MRRVLALTLLAAFAAPGCSGDEPASGEEGCDTDSCASLAQGEWGVTGDPRVDGIFRAVALFDDRVRANHARTALAVARIGEALGVEVDPEAPIEESAEQVAAAVQELFDGFVAYAAWDAGPAVADVPFAYAAQIDCLARFGCAVDPACADAAAGVGGAAPIACEGECLGACAGDCTGECLTPIDADTCTGGGCYGACELVAGGPCDGTCYGECSGTCYVLDGASAVQCMGPCDGACVGICETVHHGQGCAGACTGACSDVSGAACGGECRGECTGSCDGDCGGLSPPPGCAVEACAESTGCSSVAGLLAWTDLAATWIDYLVVWTENPEVDGWTAGEIATAMAVLEDELRAVIAASVELETLAMGTAVAHAPIQEIGHALQGLGDSVEAYGLDECALDCLEGAMGATLDLIDESQDLAMGAAMAQTWLLSPLQTW